MTFASAAPRMAASPVPCRAAAGKQAAPAAAPPALPRRALLAAVAAAAAALVPVQGAHAFGSGFPGVSTL